jgi:hypothetical protein
VTAMTRRVATVLAVCLAVSQAWGHTFPPQRTVVLQVERCEVALLVGYRPGTGRAAEKEIDASAAILARVATQPKSQGLSTLRAVMAAFAMAPLEVAIDGHALVPTSVRAKVGVEAGGARPIVVLLVTYAIPAGGKLAISSKDPRTTRFSWQDRGSERVDLATAPAQGTWFDGVADFLLSLAGPPGDSPCVTSQPPHSD